MHAIEPYWRWRDLYSAENDDRSPFYGREYSEFEFTHAIYDHVIHPQWDEMGSPTLFMKILYADYEEGFAILEFLGEWNDAITNDCMFLKRDIVDVLVAEGIYRYILIGENVLNFHGDGSDYYEEWQEDIRDEGGWIACVNFNKHVLEEMEREFVTDFLYFNEHLQNVAWRKFTPIQVLSLVEDTLLKALG
jgi:hypothetical protein